MSYLEKARQAIRPENTLGDNTDLEETLSGLFKKAMREIQINYIPGLLEHIQSKHPEIQQQMTLAEEDLESAWAEARQGRGTLGAFELALEKWQQIILAACKNHRVGPATKATKATKGREPDRDNN